MKAVAMLYNPSFKKKPGWLWNCCKLWWTLLLVLGTLQFSPTLLLAQNDSTLPNSPLKKLSLEELMNIEVTSVSKTSQNLSEVASAIQVISGEAIKRSGAFRLGDALRLTSNLQVAKINSHDFAISARGFNGATIGSNTGSASLSNKLLVLIDGRAVYNPLFGGVYWDVQNVLMEDIDRIEVVSGPGGTMWGANAVNGVINIISKSASETQGLFATGAAGSLLKDHAAVRYGGKVGEKIFYRVYGQFFDMKNTMSFDTVVNNDKWNMVQGGFRMDYTPSEKDLITLQGDVYNGNEGEMFQTKLNGQNIIGRWTHTISETSDLTVQLYFDRTYRRFTATGFTDELETYDFDFQHRFKLGKRQTILWGGGYRFMIDKINRGSVNIFFTPIDYLHLVTGFVQDQISLIPDKLELTLGVKLLSNYYSGFEYQPSGRLAFTPTKRHTLWTAVSRAIRGPTRFEEELTLDSDFKSEKVIAYELGYRVVPADKISISVATFYNQYTDVRNVNKVPPATSRTLFGNLQEVKSWGMEIFASIWLMEGWRMRTGYNYFDKEFAPVDTFIVRAGSDGLEGTDPNHQFFVQSIVDIKMFEFDVVARVVSSLPESALIGSMEVPTYASLDVRLAYKYKKFEFSVVGQDILARKHREFQTAQIPWSIYGRITVRI